MMPRKRKLPRAQQNMATKAEPLSTPATASNPADDNKNGQPTRRYTVGSYEELCLARELVDMVNESYGTPGAIDPASEVPRASKITYAQALNLSVTDNNAIGMPNSIDIDASDVVMTSFATNVTSNEESSSARVVTITAGTAESVDALVGGVRSIIISMDCQDDDDL